MNSKTTEAVEHYLGCPLSEVPYYPYWDRAMAQTGLCRPGVLSEFDDEFHTPFSRAKTPCLAYIIDRWLVPLGQHSSTPWLVLTGDKGVGKTRISEILATLWMIKTKTIARRIQWTVFLTEQRDKIGRSMVGERDIEDESVVDIYEAPLLIIDDLTTGKVGASVWSLDLLFSIQEKRVRSPTIWISNMRLAGRPTKDGSMPDSEYRTMLMEGAGRTNGDRQTYIDLVDKVTDRFGLGRGRQSRHYRVLTRTGGSYREIEEAQETDENG